MYPWYNWHKIIKFMRERIQKIKETIQDYLAIETETNVKISRLVSFFIFSLIIVNVLAVILETVSGFAVRYTELFRGIEIFSIIVFTIEYLLRLWTSTINKRFRHPVFGRLRFIVTPLALLDLFAFMPFYVPFLIPYDLRILRFIRVFRVFRLFKGSAFSESVIIVLTVLKQKRRQLIASVLMAISLIFFTSTLVYYAEEEAQPEAFTSIPVTISWGLSIFTPTINAERIFPVTTLGKFLASLTTLLGFGIIALPAGILASGFNEAMEKRVKEEEKRKNICPHCGKDITKPSKK